MSTGYDLANRINAVSGILNGAGTNYVTSATYAAHGAPSEYRYGNTLYRDYTYNTRLQPATAADTVGGLGNNTHLYLTWNWGNTNNNGNLQSSSASHGGPNYPTGFLTFNDSYSYDAVNRLAAVYDKDVNNNLLWARIFNYDQYGNMSLSVNSGVPLYGTTPVSANGYNPFNPANNRLVSARYDAAGNQTEVGSYSLAYDAESRQTIAVDNVSEGQASYGYDGLGQRVTKSNNGVIGTLYVYDIFGQLAAEYNSFAKQQSPCSTCYLSYDHLGSLRMVTDGSPNANIIARHDYLAFGEEIPANTAGRKSEWGPFGDKVNQKFTGQERDEETGFDFFGARYHSAAQGRFISVDPAFESAILELPQTWNRYAYVYNRPTFATDPNGRCPICVGAIVGGVVEGVWNLGSQVIEHGYSFSGTDWGQVGANFVGGAVVGGLAVATGGTSLFANPVVGDLVGGTVSTTVGGIATRTVEGESAGEVFAPGDIVTDAVSGFVGGGMGHVAADFIHVPEEPSLPGPRRHAVGRRKLAKYNADVAARNNGLLVRAGIGVAAASPPAHGVTGFFNNFSNIFDWLISAPPPPPTPVVTSKICFTDDNGNQVCE